MNAKNFIFVMIILSAIGSGLMAGIFYAFSTFVMQALDRLAAGSAIAAMQSINAAVPGSLFGITFLVTPLFCLITMIAALVFRAEVNLGYIVGGTLIYLVGGLLVTMIFNIPLNNVMAAVNPAAADAQEQWRSYYAGWMIWNHIRTVACGAASIFYVIALFK